ncbi:MAG: 2-oxoacid:ferredoxin oxidoreductase subunit beta [Thermoactinomyces sp.]
MATFKDFRNKIKPNWCPGCGDYSVLAAMQRAFANLGLEPHEVAVVSGIGCSGRISGYFNAYGFHGVHGRSLPIAQGLKLANRDLTVVAAGGDGDGFAIGMAHTIHAIRRNVDITYIVMDNQVYGLTKGQTSPRSQKGFITKSTPYGSIESPIHPMEMALTAGAGFIAQAFSSDLKQMTDLIEAGIKHKGFSLINVFSPCVTYNKMNTYDFFKKNLVNLDEDAEYDTSNRHMAMQKLMENHGLVTGLIYQNKEQPAYEDMIKGFKKEPLTKQDIMISEQDFNKLVAKFA